MLAVNLGAVICQSRVFALPLLAVLSYWYETDKR